jgi:hypothetical protein
MDEGRGRLLDLGGTMVRVLLQYALSARLRCYLWKHGVDVAIGMLRRRGLPTGIACGTGVEHEALEKVV